MRQRIVTLAFLLALLGLALVIVPGLTRGAFESAMAPSLRPEGCGIGTWAPAANFPGNQVRGVGVWYATNGRFYVMGGRMRTPDPRRSAQPARVQPGYEHLDHQERGRSRRLPGQQHGLRVLYTGASGILPGGWAATLTTATKPCATKTDRADTMTTLATDTWPGNASRLTRCPAASPSSNNKLYILGGFTINVSMTTQIWEFDPRRAAGTRWLLKTAVLLTPLGYVPTTSIGTLIFTGGGSTFNAGVLADATTRTCTTRSPTPSARSSLFRA